MGNGTEIIESAKERIVSVAGGPAPILGFMARETYLRDVATAAASTRAYKS
jgi:hypothetical protein